MALIHVKYPFKQLSPLCVGSILTENLIVTTRNCVRKRLLPFLVESARKLKVTIGSATPEKGLIADLYDVQEVKVHPQWIRGYDYAVLVLKTPLKLITPSFNASTVSLPPVTYAGQKANVSRYEGSSSGRNDGHARSSTVRILTTEQCSRITWPPRPDFICTEKSDTNFRYCENLDLGAPLTIKEGNKTILVGIARQSLCEQLYPVFYNVSSVYFWLAEVIGEKNCSS
ncbi:uncharacterized protein LOC141851558 [Brevipalpus obovatus]|uniref:uncharacterized protein LOC141851558 n=1 Tax=Brevipalpus obovatus TaxID=246614 RepID=UPI003D9EE46C